MKSIICVGIKNVEKKLNNVEWRISFRFCLMDLARELEEDIVQMREGSTENVLQGLCCGHGRGVQPTTKFCYTDFSLC
jgi:hypothetical protein